MEIEDFGRQSSGLLATTDGRIRNPVPHKLQGMADDKNGNFSVMHIDLGGTEKAERNAAAKRTSEGTEKAAKLANKGGYQAIKRSKLAWQPLEVTGLSAQETKTEQARLLTLLRTVHPVVVVDQLCKALAYFGGIPGAPAPSDTREFPTSAGSNGPGSAFVGWVSEIFPNVEAGQPGSMAAASAALGNMNSAGIPTPTTATSVIPPPTPTKPQAPTSAQKKETPVLPPPAPGAPPALNPDGTPVKRGRGRPKGSKGKKKMEADAAAAAGQSAPTGQPIAPMSTPLVGGIAPPGLPQSWSGQSLGDAATGDNTVNVTPSGKKRGRPKGSKNKPKVAGDADGENATASGTPTLPKPTTGKSPHVPVANMGQPGMSRPTGAGWTSDFGTEPQQSPSVETKAASRKRKSDKANTANDANNAFGQAMNSTQALNNSLGGGMSAGQLSNPQQSPYGAAGGLDPSGKRRRMSKETHPQPMFTRPGPNMTTPQLPNTNFGAPSQMATTNFKRPPSMQQSPHLPGGMMNPSNRMPSPNTSAANYGQPQPMGMNPEYFNRSGAFKPGQQQPGMARQTSNDGQRDPRTANAGANAGFRGQQQTQQQQQFPGYTDQNYLAVDYSSSQPNMYRGMGGR